MFVRTESSDLANKKRIVRIIDNVIGQRAWGYFSMPSPYTVAQIINVVPVYTNGTVSGPTLNTTDVFEWYTDGSNRLMTNCRDANYSIDKAYVYLWVDD
jgi:hypothetical protein